jgi:hypothetical protein
MFEYNYLITSLYSARSNIQNTVYELAKPGTENYKMQSLKELLLLNFLATKECYHIDFIKNPCKRTPEHGNPIIMIYENKQILCTGTDYFPMKDIEVNCGF